MASSEGSPAIPMDQPHSDKCPQIELPFARDFEYQAGWLSAGVEGRLFRARAFWLSKLSCPLFVKNIVTYGYALPLKRFPASAFLNNNQSALAHSSFVEEAIAKLLTNRCIKECDVGPRVVNPLSVAEGKKLRLDLGAGPATCQPVRGGHALQVRNFKALAELFEAGFYFFTFDLESGFHHVSVVEHHQQLLGFSWLFPDGKRRFYNFRVLPFGLSSACYVFTKLMRPLVARWRSMGHVALVYIDDGISGVADRTSAKAASIIQRKDLLSSGLKVNEAKSDWEPRQLGQWLGIIINTIQMTFQVPSSKLERLKSAIRDVLGCQNVPVKDIARISGYLVAMTIALGPIARLFTRQMYFVIANRISWRGHVVVNEPLAQELKFWLHHVDAFYGYAIKRKFSATAIVCSDASDTGFGGFTALVGSHVSTGLWGPLEAFQSSTFRELKAILHILQSFSTLLSHHKVRWFSDNQNVCRIVCTGSPKPDLQAIAVSIFQPCMSFDIAIEIEWLPRPQNEKAD